MNTIFKISLSIGLILTGLVCGIDRCHAITWAKTYEGTGNSWGNEVHQTLDEGYIVSGVKTTSSGVINSFSANKLWIAKLNKDGAVVWQKTYGGGGEPWANSVQQTSDHGYIASTVTFAHGRALLRVLKLNRDGDVVWQKLYGEIGNEYHQNSVRPTRDGGYIVATVTTAFGAGNQDIWILKLNADGTVAWQKTYGGAGNDDQNSIRETSDGGYIVAGNTLSFSNNNGAGWILKLNADGTVAWQKTYGVQGGCWMDIVQQTTKDGGYIVAGGTNSAGAGGWDAWILKLAADGKVVWQKTYGKAGNDEISSIQQTAEGGFIANGYMTDKSGTFTWVMKLDPMGKIIWQKTYGETFVCKNIPSVQDTCGFGSIQETFDHGFVLAGSRKSAITGQHNGFLAKLDPNGKIEGCVNRTTRIAVNVPRLRLAVTSVKGQDTSVTPQTSGEAVLELRSVGANVCPIKRHL
jgi:hypothetical protein